MHTFLSLVTVAEEHAVAVRGDAVRIMEDVYLDSDPARHVGVQVTLTDGTTYTVKGSVDELIKQLEAY